MNTPLCFVDTETTGVHPDREVWEVAIIRRDGRGNQAGRQFFVELDLAQADPFALNNFRFYDRHPVGQWLTNPIRSLYPRSSGDYLTKLGAARTIAHLTHRAHIVGAVPNFDTEVLGQLLRRHGLMPTWHYHLIDVEAMMVGYLNALASAAKGDGWSSEKVNALRDQAAPPWKSDELSRAIGVEPPSDHERHTAMGDAYWAMRIYDKITGS